MQLLENGREALRAIRANRLRAGITILIIAFGIMAMVGVLTSIDSIKFWLRSSFSTMGANTFKVQSYEGSLRIGGRRSGQSFRKITLAEATRYQDELQKQFADAKASISSSAPSPMEVRHGKLKTNRNVILSGVDINFLSTQSYAIAQGRFLGEQDLAKMQKVAVVGSVVAQKLFPYSNPLGKDILLGGKQYRVVGVFEEKGTAFGSRGDKVVVIPLTTILADFPSASSTMELSVYVPDAGLLDGVIANSRGIFRVARRLHPTQPDDFSMVKSDSFVENLMNNLQILTFSATAIALITLLGASVGLMNIMLVSVSERTMEIGLRKSLGATRKAIQQQFLTEAVVICQLGGLVGILLGVGIAAGVGSAMGTEFFIPWNWIFLAIFLCLAIGIFSGLYPARKAAKLDPIEALRQGI